MHWACLFLPQLALDGVLRTHPAPDAPFALVAGPAQRRLLQAVNPAARSRGLRSGMALAAARVLCPELSIADYDARHHARLQALLAAWAYRFSSHVSTDLAHAVVLEVGHSLRLFGPWPRLEQRLRDELHGLGVRHRIVLAPNPHAARVLANVHDGLVVDEGMLDNALGQLPVERAGLPREVAAALVRMGLRRLRQVFALPRESVTRRFPADVLQHLDRLRGHAVPALRWYRPPDRFDARIEFDHGIESSQALLFPLRRLTADLAAFLAARDGGVQRFDLLFEHERMAPTVLVVGLLAPEREASMLFELARGRIEQVRLPAPAHGLQLAAAALPPFVPAAHDLFDARAQQATSWLQLRERLRARLGGEAVRTPGWRADHRPEHAAGHEGACQPPPAPPPRPGWLLPCPVPLRERGLRVIAGPERIESGWWDGGDVRRDYYLVETPRGQRAWVYCPAGDPRVAEAGMLHGWFA